MNINSQTPHQSTGTDGRTGGQETSVSYKMQPTKPPEYVQYNRSRIIYFVKSKWFKHKGKLRGFHKGERTLYQIVAAIK